jgi:extracellular factor (EF) 3-hydroxypalmitic acid methyl ester biosynthesis protein
MLDTMRQEKHRQQEDGLWLLRDRRANPFIRSRQRRNFDRRASYRAGSKALALVRHGDDLVSCALSNISDSGAQVEIPAEQLRNGAVVQIGIPTLYNSPIICETAWQRHVQGNGHVQCGVKFIGLTGHHKAQLRKQILMNEQVLLHHVESIASKVADEQQKNDIKAFFFIDLRMAIERMIDIDAGLPQNISPGTVADICEEPLERLVSAGDELDTSLQNIALVKEIKSRVRLLLGQFFYQSQVMRRSLEKPRGYPGDYQMLEMLYDNTEVSGGIGCYLDRFALNRPYSRAVRRRKDMMKDMLYSFINTSNRHSLRILNLASGSCREIREMLDRTIRYQGNVELTCIDQDEEAISYSKEQLAALDRRNISVNFIQGNILRLEDLDIGPDDSLDMVYSIGIADYLQDRMLTKIFRDSFQKLRPGGKLVVAYKDKDKNKPLSINWYVDWNFVPRNEQEFMSLISGALAGKNYSIAVKRERTDIIFFAEITRES